jgi:hypothetical protein
MVSLRSMVVLPALCLLTSCRGIEAGSSTAAALPQLVPSLRTLRGGASSAAASLVSTRLVYRPQNGAPIPSEIASNIDVKLVGSWYASWLLLLRALWAHAAGALLHLGEGCTRGSGAREKSCFRESICRQQLMHMHLRGIVFQVGMAAVPQREMECSGKSLRVSSTRTRRSFSLSLRLSMRQ